MMRSKWFVLGIAPAVAVAAAVADSFLWLEEVYGDKAMDWVKQQNERTLAHLQQDPRFAEYQQTALKMHRADDVGVMHVQLYDGWVYHLFEHPVLHPYGLWRRARLESYLTNSPQWQPLLDLDALAKDAGRPSRFLTRYVDVACYLNRCMVGIEDMRSRRIDTREFDLSKGEFVKNGFAFTDASEVPGYAWKDENSLQFVSSVEATTAKRISIKEWLRGQPMSSAPEIFHIVNPSDAAESSVKIGAARTKDDKLFSFAYISGKHPEVFWLRRSGHHVPLLWWKPGLEIVGVYEDQLVLWLRKDMTIGRVSPKSDSLVSIPISQIGESAPKVHALARASSRGNILQVVITANGVLVCSVENVAGRIDLFLRDGQRWERQSIVLPNFGSVALLGRDAMNSDFALAMYESLLEPPTVYAIDTSTRHARPVRRKATQFDSAPYITEQWWAASKDGVRVPYFIVHPRNFERHGHWPTLMHGYGALGNPQRARYDGAVGRLWLDKGGVYVWANVRGGSEFGMKWYVRRMDRRHTYEDFIAIAEDLVRRKVTSPDYLGAIGHSNGGLLVGTTLNMRPDLFSAGVMENPVLDLEVHNASDLQAPEYGSWNIPEEREFLLRTSPYHALERHTNFPQVLVTDSIDDQDFPKMARKYVAKGQSLGLSIFYYELPRGGHNPRGLTVEDAALHDAMVYTYLAERLMPAHRSSSLLGAKVMVPESGFRD